MRSMGQTMVTAKPMRNVLCSATIPMIHGMAKHPALPTAAIMLNIDAPPCGKWSAMKLKVVGHKQLTVTPTATQAASAIGGMGKKHPIE